MKCDLFANEMLVHNKIGFTWCYHTNILKANYYSFITFSYLYVHPWHHPVVSLNSSGEENVFPQASHSRENVLPHNWHCSLNTKKVSSPHEGQSDIEGSPPSAISFHVPPNSPLNVYIINSS